MPKTRRSMPTFRHGELHLVVLAMLERQPMHGYQLLSELARLFGPGYRPSPGSVYPRIEALSRSGLVEGVDDGGRRVYSLTPSGADALAQRLHDLVAIESRTGVRLVGGDEVEALLGRFVARVRAAAPRLDLAVLDEALGDVASRLEEFAARGRRPETDTTTRRKP